MLEYPNEPQKVCIINKSYASFRIFVVTDTAQREIWRRYSGFFKLRNTLKKRRDWELKRHAKTRRTSASDPIDMDTREAPFKDGGGNLEDRKASFLPPFLPSCLPYFTTFLPSLITATFPAKPKGYRPQRRGGENTAREEEGGLMSRQQISWSSGRRSAEEIEDRIRALMSLQKAREQHGTKEASKGSHPSLDAYPVRMSTAPAGHMWA